MVALTLLRGFVRSSLRKAAVVVADVAIVVVAAAVSVHGTVFAIFLLHLSLLLFLSVEASPHALYIRIPSPLDLFPVGLLLLALQQHRRSHQPVHLLPLLHQTGVPHPVEVQKGPRLGHDAGATGPGIDKRVLIRKIIVTKSKCSAWIVVFKEAIIFPLKFEFLLYPILIFLKNL